MAFVEVEVDGKVISRRESSFGNDKVAKKVSDTINRKNIKATSSRSRRKKK